MESEALTFIEVWTGISANIMVLAVAGAMGALMDAWQSPVAEGRSRLSRAVKAFMSAIFLGGFFAGLVDGFVSNPFYAYLASGYICGHAGPAAVRMARRKFFGEESD